MGVRRCVSVLNNTRQQRLPTEAAYSGGCGTTNLHQVGRRATKLCLLVHGGSRLNKVAHIRNVDAHLKVAVWQGLLKRKTNTPTRQAWRLRKPASRQVICSLNNPPHLHMQRIIQITRRGWINAENASCTVVAALRKLLGWDGPVCNNPRNNAAWSTHRASAKYP